MEKTTKKPEPTRNHTKQHQVAKKAKLASALRDNLKRRKAPASAPSKDKCDG